MASGEECRRVSQWSDTWVDVLDLIAKKLIRASDYLRFRCVCKSWRSIAEPANLPPHLPLLMLRYHPSTERRSVFCVSTRQIRTVSILELVNKVILTASRGWLLLLDVAPADGRLFLLNPLTGDEIQLPPTDGFVHLHDYEFSPVDQKFLSIRHGTDSTLDLLQYERIFPWRAFLLSSPNTAPMDCMVVIAACYPFVGFVAFCRLGDESWTMMDTGLLRLPASVAHHEGSLYVIEMGGKFSICELACPWNPKLFDLPFMDFGHNGNVFLVTTSSQLLFFSPGDLYYYRGYYAVRFFVVFKLMPGYPPNWSPVERIRDIAVFRSRDLYQSIIVCARDIPGYQEDRVYTSDPFDISYAPSESGVHQIDVDDLSTGDFEHLSCDRMEPNSQELLHPVWFELSLRKMLE